jgi:ApaG protein
MYEATTRNIRVSVEPAYDESRSRPNARQYFWVYTVEISNGGQTAVRLRSRTWRITDAQGRVQEVRGKGVVGQQPVIEPGQTFRYSSGAPLTTPTGFMAGLYHMECRGEEFDIEIPAFSLDSPFIEKRLN